MSRPSDYDLMSPGLWVLGLILLFLLLLGA